jgi:cell division protein ZapE
MSAKSFDEAISEICKQRGIKLDAAQQRAAARLSAMAQELDVFTSARMSWIKRTFAAPEAPKSVWFYGGVGRGKSFLMDAFYASTRVRRKTRIHFHAFMRSVHAQLKLHKNVPDPLLLVADDITKKYRLLCFDEFHVSDIADAMILGRLLEALFERGIVICTTSNYHPSKLYPNGLQRDRFEPAIAMILEKFDVLEVDAGVDYRLRELTQVQTFYTPITNETQTRLTAIFEKLRTAQDEPPALIIEGREIRARRVAGDVAWFDFRALCDGPRSQVDYLELARDYHTIILSDIPKLSPDDSNAARRFTLLIDVLYDHAVKFICSSAVPANEIYVKGAMSHEFPRTLSRLAEMQSAEYMAKPHVAAGEL